MKYLGIIVLVFMSCMAVGQAPPASIQFSVSTSDIVVGDPISHTIKITQNDPNTFVIFPKLDDAYYANFSIVEAGKIDTLNTDGQITYAQTNIITGFDSGLFVLPKIDVSIIQNDSNTNISTNDVPIRVKNVPVNLNGDIKDIIGDINEIPIWLMVLMALLGIALIFLIYKIIKWWQAKKKAKSAIVPLSPLQLAMQQLQLAKQDIEKNDFKEAISKSTKAFKGYIENRFQVQVLDKTTTDFMKIVRSHTTLQNQSQNFNNWLMRADMLKFAKADANAQMLQQDIQDITQLINQWEATFVAQEEANVTK